jgi:hypothetical protein
MLEPRCWKNRTIDSGWVIEKLAFDISLSIGRLLLTGWYSPKTEVHDTVACDHCEARLLMVNGPGANQ